MTNYDAVMKELEKRNIWQGIGPTSDFYAEYDAEGISIFEAFDKLLEENYGVECTPWEDVSLILYTSPTGDQWCWFVADGEKIEEAE